MPTLIKRAVVTILISGKVDFRESNTVKDKTAIS